MTFGYRDVAARATYRCEYCHAPEALTNLLFFVDHIVPRSRAPDLIDDPENLALACPACNLYKADRITGTDSMTGEVVSLFHPRRSVWAEHFVWDDDQVSLRGLTSTGRATIVSLRINSPAQQRARAFWLTTDLFP